jgi:hypothetical protein
LASWPALRMSPIAVSISGRMTSRHFTQKA